MLSVYALYCAIVQSMYIYHGEEVKSKFSKMVEIALFFFMKKDFLGMKCSRKRCQMSQVI
jgi:hypothetical protein